MRFPQILLPFLAKKHQAEPSRVEFRSMVDDSVVDCIEKKLRGQDENSPSVRIVERQGTVLVEDATGRDTIIGSIDGDVIDRIPSFRFNIVRKLEQMMNLVNRHPRIVCLQNATNSLGGSRKTSAIRKRSIWRGTCA